ncbi:MAG: NAD(P)/FAD-dependent oxidoreductase [Alphaproteobacteria bacterium]
MAAADRVKAVIVGGGHNGLVAAFYLARAGLDVTVLERRPVVGGPCAAIEFFPGYHGAITNSPGSLEPKIVLDMDLERHGLAFVKADPTVVQPFDGDRAFVGWRERGRTERELAKFSAKDVVAYYALFDFFNAFGAKLGVSLFCPPPKFSDLMARMVSPEDEAAFAEVMFGSIRDFVDARFESDEIKALVAALAVMSNLVGPSTPGTPCMLLQRPMSLASGSIAAEHDPRKQPLRGSTGLPLGGMGSIARAMERSLAALGVTIRTGAAVDHIKTRDGRVTGVALADGEEHDADIVLSNLNPKTTLLDLVPRTLLPSSMADRLGRLVMRGSAFKMVLALDGLPRFAAAGDDEEARAMAGCQFRIAPTMDYMDRGYEAAKRGELHDFPMMWGLTPSVADPSLAPKGKQVMSVNMWYVPYHLKEGDWALERDRYGDRCIDMLSAFIPNLKDIVIDRRYWSPADIEREFGMLEANVVHGDMVPGRMFGFRPLPELSDYRTPIGGLYLCGSGAWPGGTVSGLPGHNGAHQALSDLQEGMAKVQTLLDRRFSR